MATFSLPTAASTYNGGEDAIGTLVRADIEAVRAFVVGKNLDQDNIATLEDTVLWNVTSTAGAINIQSESSTTEISVRRLGTIGVGGDPAELAKPLINIQSGSTGVNFWDDSLFYASPNGNKLAGFYTTAERDLIPTGASLPDGVVIYNTDDQEYQASRNGSEWISLGSSPAVVVEAANFTDQFSGTSGVFLAASTTPALVSRGGSAVLLFLQGNPNTSAGVQHNSTGPTALNPSFQCRWAKSINGGSFTTVSEFRWESPLESSGAYPTIQALIPAGSWNSIDTATHTEGDSIVYRFEIAPGTGFTTSRQLKAVAVEIA